MTIGEDGRIITDVKLGTGLFSTELTLNFTGSHYEDAKANPAIVKNRFLQRTAVTTFKLLAGSVLRDVEATQKKRAV